jgi:hypothetical protein
LFGAIRIQLPSAIAFLRVVFAAHKRRVVEAASSAFTMRINVVDRKIFPRQFAPTSCAHLAGTRVPNDPALLWSETPLCILPSEQATENSAQCLFTFTSLGNIVCHL